MNGHDTSIAELTENTTMQVRMMLMGALKEKTPPENRLELPEGATIEDSLSQLGIEPQEVQIVMLNGKPMPNRQQTVTEGDELTVLAPVGGG